MRLTALSALIVVLHCVCQIVWLEYYVFVTPFNEHIFRAVNRGFDAVFISLMFFIAYEMRDNDFKGFVLMEGVFILFRGIIYVLHYSGLLYVNTEWRINTISVVMIAYLIPTLYQLWRRSK
jgi:uncharacterized membrane protein YecN with MAPEG domain